MTTRDIEGEFGAIKDDLAKLRADIANLSSALKDLTSETVQERLDTLRSGIDRLTDDAKLQSREMLDDLTDKIEEKPLASILIAFGVGILMGRLFAR
jgi:ElaB/YqjD/DUF883 family membrane-anchored ribosome-binding protein